MRASDILAELKARDKYATFTMAQCSPTHMQLVTAWSAVQVPDDTDPDEECPPATPPHLLVRWLWSRLEPDPMPAWIEAAGLPNAPHIRRTCRVLQDNGVVLPDGSLAGSVEEYLRLKYEASVDRLRPRGED